MIIAIPVWMGRVAPLFDVSCTARLYQVNKQETERLDDISFPVGAGAVQRTALLRNAGVDVLICGAVSRYTMRNLQASGVDVRAFAAGETDDVLQAFMAGDLQELRFRMPGCGRHCRRGGGFNRRGRGDD